MKKFLGCTLIVILSMVSMACAKQFPSLDCCSPTASPTVSQDQIDKFAQKDITLMPKGEILKIIIPTDKFFKPNLVTIKNCQKPALTQVANLLKQYGNASVKVLGYTDDVASPSENKKLSLGRAQAVLAYFWAQGLDADHLYAAGLGGTDLVGDAHDVFANSANRRIEILVHAKCTQCY